MAIINYPDAVQWQQKDPSLRREISITLAASRTLESMMTHPEQRGSAYAVQEHAMKRVTARSVKYIVLHSCFGEALREDVLIDWADALADKLGLAFFAQLTRSHNRPLTHVAIVVLDGAVEAGRFRKSPEALATICSVVADDQDRRNSYFAASILGRLPIKVAAGALEKFATIGCAQTRELALNTLSQSHDAQAVSALAEVRAYYQKLVDRLAPSDSLVHSGGSR